MLPKTVNIGAHAESFSLGETVLVLLTVMVLLQQVYCYASRPSSTVPLWRYFVPETPFLWPVIAFLLAATLATFKAQFHTVAFRYDREVIIEPALYYSLLLQRLRGAWVPALLAASTAPTRPAIAILCSLQYVLR